MGRLLLDAVARTLRVSLAAALMCSACASHHQLPPQAQLKAEIEAMRKAVAETVPDAQRAARLDKAINGYETELLAFEKQVDTFRSKVEALNSRPDATRAEFDTLVGGSDQQRIATRTRLVELHAEMIAATTAEEWKGLAKYERAVLSVPPDY